MTEQWKRSGAGAVVSDEEGSEASWPVNGALLKLAREDPEVVQTSLARDAMLLANVRDSVIVTDLDGIVTYWNEGATRLFGWKAEEMLGRHYASRFPEPARSFIEANMHALANGAEWDGE